MGRVVPTTYLALREKSKQYPVPSAKADSQFEKRT
jgi:hypothetical protein